MKLNYCTECARPLNKLSDTKYQCADGHEYYNNPQAACAIIFVNQNNQLLYSKRAGDPAKGKYDFPGGFLDYGEDAYQGAVREIQEETGAAVTASDLELIDSQTNHYEENNTTCDFIFLCRRWQGDLLASDDVAALEWHELDFLRSGHFAWPYKKRLHAKLQRLLA
jgi:mutator protein MutT